jgi:hypothetical protein
LLVAFNIDLRTNQRGGFETGEMQVMPMFLNPDSCHGDSNPGPLKCEADMLNPTPAGAV